MENNTRALSFRKESRLLSREDFLYLKSESKRYSTSSLLLYYKDSRLRSKNTRIGFSISKKVGKAFFRNRLKRILREVFRCSSYKNSGLDGLFVVNPKIGQIFTSQEEIERNLIKDFNKLLIRATNYK